MRCLHPACPIGGGLTSWSDVVTLPETRVRPIDRPAVLSALASCGVLGVRASPIPPKVLKSACLKRILALCPCLYAQVQAPATAAAVVHLCEVTIGAKIDATNVYRAFQVQHPGMPGTPFLHAPVVNKVKGGDIMEALCSEVLANHGLPLKKVGADGWPEWTSKSHVSLNSGKLRVLKLYGDLLLPAAPHNVLVSVKSEAARERFVVSGNRLESVGFGFFKDAAEFWTTSRMNLLKRWGFIAVYMPEATLKRILTRLVKDGRESESVNINGRPLYRPLEDFGSDMYRIAGRVTIDL
jgi:hypothetical protein